MIHSRVSEAIFGAALLFAMILGMAQLLRAPSSIGFRNPSVVLPQDQPYTIDDVAFPAQNHVFYAPKEPLAEDELPFVVEIPKGSPMKYETRTATGQLFLDRELCPREVLEEGEVKGWVHEYPTHYGFAAGYFNEDGDPIDLLVLGADEKYEAMIRDRAIEPQIVRVIGLLMMEECDRIEDKGEGCSEDMHWEQDWKVLAVDLEGEYAALTDVHQLPAEVIAPLDRFFSNYKGPLADADGDLQPQTRVAGVKNKSETLGSFLSTFARIDSEARAKRVSDCRALFKQRLATAVELPSAPKIDTEFLGCLEDVHDTTFFESEAHFTFFVNYGAYQWLCALAKGDAKKMEGVSLENAVEAMQALRDNNYETHYRLVSFDAPAPGLATPIFEWVKTKNRNDGCPADTPGQHYEQRPLIDVGGLEFGDSDR